MKKSLYVFLLLFISFILLYCTSYKPRNSKTEPSNQEGQKISTQIDFSKSPVVPADEAIDRMQVEEGFEVKLVASEPLISAPVALTFDARGRIWVVEMNGYMPDTLGTGEDLPNGKIVILEDSNKDGVADTRKVFLDSLVMPRALCLIDKGILVAEPPNLWYFEIINDKPARKILVDNKYTEGGNPEHQPNGLLRAMDNWIYNSDSQKRYRKKGNQWIIEQTHTRGQWGMSPDNYGRLYYNNNSENVLGDYFTPGFGATNKNQRAIAGFNEKIVTDTRLYPSRPTPGVNRGYVPGILDSTLRLIKFTSACGPLLYRGDLFGPEYDNNAFVPEPAANLIKRNILNENGFVVSGKPAYSNKEFLTSLDERFRPVSLYNGPDGSLFVVDMYRGILEHATFITPYLKNEINRRALTLPLSCGRIYKIVPKNNQTKLLRLPDNPKQLVKFLGHPNGWVRDKTQQILVDGKMTLAIPALRQAIKESNEPLLILHALWTLEGLEALKKEEVISLLSSPLWPVRMQALSVLPSVLSTTSYKHYLSELELMINRDDILAMPYIAFLSNNIRSFDKEAAKNLLHKVVRKYPDNKYVASAVISTLQDQEEPFLKELTALQSNKNLAIYKELESLVSSIKNARAVSEKKSVAKEFLEGAALYASSCQACHGADGNGVKFLAPPINKSEWVTGNKEQLISIILFGLTGPVKVNGHLYKVPEINGDMPGIGFNQGLSNREITSLLNFIRKSWNNDGEIITINELIKVRQKLKDRQKAFTVEELEKM